jgi:hypothetical protein
VVVVMEREDGRCKVEVEVEAALPFWATRLLKNA